MKLFLKYATISLAVQAVLLLGLGLVGNLISPAVDLVFELFLRIYEPMILFIARFGNFKGESAMIEPVWMGTVLGVFSYSIVIGLVVSLLKRGR